MLALPARAGGPGPSPSPPPCLMSPSPETMRTRVWSLAVFACILLVSGQFWAGREALDAARDARENEVLGVARTTASALEQFLSIARRSTSSLAWRQGAALLTPEGCNDAVGALGDAFPFFPNLFVVDSAGVLQCSAAGMPDDPLSVADRTWFRRIVESESFAVGEPVTGRVSDVWVVVAGSPILDEEGHFRGAVAGSIELLRLEEILNERGPVMGELVTITTDQGVVVARSVDAERWVGRPLPSGTVDVEPRGERTYVTRARDADGTARVWGRVDLPDLGWRVYAGVPRQNLQSVGGGALFRHAATAGLGVLLILLLTALLTRGTVDGPRRDEQDAEHREDETSVGEGRTEVRA